MAKRCFKFWSNSFRFWAAREAVLMAFWVDMVGADVVDFFVISGVDGDNANFCLVCCFK